MPAKAVPTSLPAPAGHRAAPATQHAAHPAHVPLGVNALSSPLGKAPLGQSMSLPNLHRTAGGAFSGLQHLSPKGLSSGSPHRGAAASTLGASLSSPKHGLLPRMMEADTLQFHTHSLSPKASPLRSTFQSDAQRTFNGHSTMQGVWGLGPPRAGATRRHVPRGVFDRQHVFEASPAPATQFRRYFERGDIPVAMRHGATPGVEWKVDPEKLDYVRFLPIFVDGLLEKVEPYSVLAYQGVQDMIEAAKGKEPSKLTPALPSLIIPLKRALNTKDPGIMCRAINVLQQMIRCDERLGEMLVPYYRQILPVFNLFRGSNHNLGDGIEYSQRKRENMGDLIAETLELLERTGGEDAFINIKYMIPTYESVVSL